MERLREAANKGLKGIGDGKTDEGGMIEDDPTGKMSVATLLDSEYQRCNLTEDVYTTAWLSYQIWSKGKIDNKIMQVLLVALVIVMQGFILSESTSDVIDIWYDKVNLWNMAASALYHTGTTMPIEMSQKICGTFKLREYFSADEGNTIKMSDGTTYAPISDEFPTFRSIKVPSNSWYSDSLGLRNSHLDESLYILGANSDLFSIEGYSSKSPLDRLNSQGASKAVSYSTIFTIAMMAIFYAFLIQIRDILAFQNLCYYLRSLGYASDDDQSIVMANANLKKLKILRISATAFWIGVVTSFIRLAIAMSFIGASYFVLMFSVSKWDLLKNSVVLHFVLRLDRIVYEAYIRDTFQVLLACADPVQYKNFNIKFPNMWKFLCLFGAFAFTQVCRFQQLQYFQKQFDMVSTLCMLGGPKPSYFSQEPVFAPATGLCESLLDTLCAPNITGKGRNRGACVVVEGDRLNMELESDYPFRHPMFQAYLDEWLYPSLEWNEGNSPGHQELRDTWAENPHVAHLRKYCIAVFQPKFRPDVRLVDESTQETMLGAPFFCPRRVMDEQLLGRYTSWLENLKKKDADWKALDARKFVMFDKRSVVMLTGARVDLAGISSILNLREIQSRCRARKPGEGQQTGSLVDEGGTTVNEPTEADPLSRVPEPVAAAAQKMPKRSLMRRHMQTHRLKRYQEERSRGRDATHMQQDAENSESGDTGNFA